MDEDWFEVEDDEVDDRQKAFVDRVRSYARNWPECLPQYTTVLVFEPGEEMDDDEIEEDKGELRLIVDVCDIIGKRVLLTLGAILVEGELLCSAVHNQTYWPEENPLVTTVKSSGDPEELGETAAAWFEEVLRRPVIGQISGPGRWSFVPPGSPLPKGYRWMRGGHLSQA
ncbi:hypothetical protein QQY66_27610 [Streptomyces sp. DG2A-72]|uniref:hypothetical protein n=1 Tax=Streptomyces sp. DG2A-72 TaxID=3051386 RepID=UPI00265C2A20|nr:hypothetical protein [Streptomyces sp. DG2A-72]MDO0935252.1 hypothetical protein [Streptomyces sp. DG2A-72]